MAVISTIVRGLVLFGAVLPATALGVPRINLKKFYLVNPDPAHAKPALWKPANVIKQQDLPTFSAASTITITGQDQYTTLFSDLIDNGALPSTAPIESQSTTIHLTLPGVVVVVPTSIFYPTQTLTYVSVTQSPTTTLGVLIDPDHTIIDGVPLDQWQTENPGAILTPVPGPGAGPVPITSTVTIPSPAEATETVEVQLTVTQTAYEESAASSDPYVFATEGPTTTTLRHPSTTTLRLTRLPPVFTGINEFSEVAPGNDFEVDEMQFNDVNDLQVNDN